MRKFTTTTLLVAAIVFSIFILFAHSAYCKNGGTKASGVSSLYKITKYSRYVSGYRWRYVLVDEKATKRDIQSIYNDLRARYPNDYFELFNDEDTLVGMYEHSMKRGKFPDNKGHLGMITKMGAEQEWKFTSMGGYSLLEE